MNDTSANQTNTTTNDSNLAEFEAVQLKPYYECTRNGIYYVALETDKDGNTTEKPPLKLSSEIKLIGYGVDQDGSYHRIIEWHDTNTRKARTMALPMADIGHNWAVLKKNGIVVLSGRRKQELLADYLQTEGEKTYYTITNQAGWCDGNKAYILPSGQIVTATATKGKQIPKIIYNGDTSQASAYAQRGDLKGWQDNVGKYMVGNSRLCLAIGTALAAPLVRLLGIEAGGFHMFYDSRGGKTTALMAALSVWGNPDGLKLTWTATSNGINNVANAKNDGLLALDEVGQADPRHVSQIAYSVINGVSKIQGAKEGGNRKVNKWKVLLLSTGEKPLDGFLRTANQPWNAGQAARMPSISLDAGKGFGAFDTLHGFEKGSELSEAITANVQNYHGQVGIAFVRLLLDNPNACNEARGLMQDFMSILPDVDGQARTIATRFALVAAALELAARHGILGFNAGLCMPAIKQCFDSWVERSGTGKFEDAKILEQGISCMQKYANSDLFVLWPLSNGCRTPDNLMGYKKIGGQSSEEDIYYILPEVFQKEFCKDFDVRKVCEVLHSADWLQRNNDVRWKYLLRGKGWHYMFNGALPPSELQE